MSIYSVFKGVMFIYSENTILDTDIPAFDVDISSTDVHIFADDVHIFGVFCRKSITAVVLWAFFEPKIDIIIELKKNYYRRNLTIDFFLF